MRRAAGIAALVGAAAVAGGLARGDRLPPLPGPAPRAHGLVDGLGALSGNGSCAGCHADIAVEWRRSLHRRAWADPVFQQAYTVEPIAFCRGCHAPESDLAVEPIGRAADEGVGCTTCHVAAGHVVSSSASPSALHPVFADARFATEQACAGCHQFDFPSEALQRVAQPMQDTIAEHARSTAKDAPCQSCHMPLVDGREGRHRSHDFAVLADPSMIRRAARVTAERADGNRVAVTLAPAAAGHAFPTGDMFRRLEVRAFAVDKNGEVVAAEPVILARTFRDAPRDPHGGGLDLARVEAADTRVPPPGGPSRRVLVQLPDGARGEIRWRVVYQRMAAPMAEAFHVDQVLDEVVVAEGVLPPPAIAWKGARP